MDLYEIYKMEATLSSIMDDYDSDPDGSFRTNDAPSSSLKSALKTSRRSNGDYCRRNSLDGNGSSQPSSRGVRFAEKPEIAPPIETLVIKYGSGGLKDPLFKRWKNEKGGRLRTMKNPFKEELPLSAKESHLKWDTLKTEATSVLSEPTAKPEPTTMDTISDNKGGKQRRPSLINTLQGIVSSHHKKTSGRRTKSRSSLTSFPLPMNLLQVENPKNHQRQTGMGDDGSSLLSDDDESISLSYFDDDDQDDDASDSLAGSHSSLIASFLFCRNAAKKPMDCHSHQRRKQAALNYRPSLVGIAPQAA